ncbi:GNAT family N-acetyltransferase [Crocinitomix catalasitica]|nr:GNAT family N-acetyltransferase [Crocinitomix catalasitica]
MKSVVEIRNASLGDLSSIVELLNQLGYSMNKKDLHDSVETIVKAENHYLYLAIIHGRSVGLLHAFYTARLTKSPFVEISALVVKEDERGKRIGRLLVEKIEVDTNTKFGLRVRCNVNRQGAHKFYSNLGYSIVKEQKVFHK